jgi:hypothetical protein
MQSIEYRKASELYPDLQWNYRSDWSIPLPIAYLKVGSYGIVARWFVPDEVPVGKTGWLYELENGDVVIEASLDSRENVW